MTDIREGTDWFQVSITIRVWPAAPQWSVRRGVAANNPWITLRGLGRGMATTVEGLTFYPQEALGMQECECVTSA